jgi:hypothetical protein
MPRQLITYKIVNNTGISISTKSLEVIKKNRIICLNETVGGDAPKDVIKMYTFGEAKKSDKKNWKKYIAKIGHKWYPNESITEDYLTKVGESFGIIIARSRLIIAEGYVRFLSEHFHSSEETLNHGANILSRYINETDTQWIDDLDRLKTLKKEVNIIDVLSALKIIFKDDYKSIIKDFLHMILFDALTGNNDRHYYNWGVVSHIKNSYPPYFSPIYDSARGLLWNLSDDKVREMHKQLSNINNKKLENYILKSVPKISIPKNDSCNHFELIEYLESKKIFEDNHKEKWCNENLLNFAIERLRKDYKDLFIKERIELIEHILKFRFKKIIEILK